MIGNDANDGEMAIQKPSSFFGSCIIIFVEFTILFMNTKRVDVTVTVMPCVVGSVVEGASLLGSL